MKLNHHCFREKFGHFLVDTGSQLNIIKRSSIIPSTTVNTNVVYNITGIDSGSIRTCGEVVIKVNLIDVKFQTVSDDLPIPESGILGMPFLENQNAIMKFGNDEPNSLRIGDEEFFLLSSSSFRLPPRSRTLVALPVKEPGIKEGYIKKLTTQPGVFMGEALVRQQNGSAKLYAINTTPNPVTVTIPPVELEAFIELPPSPRSSRTGNPNVDKSRADSSRLIQIAKILELDGLNEDEQSSILEIIREFPYQFYLPSDKLHSTNTIQHSIETVNETPINTKQYRFPPIHKDEIRNQVSALLEKGIIQQSTSPYNSPVWVVPKKVDSAGKRRWRMVIDYRLLNEKTVSDAYPLPNITEILDQLGAAKYFSTLDLVSGFHQIPMDPKSKPKTAFSTLNGHYEFNKMPFGLKNAPATFQRCMDLVLSGLQGVELFVYMDDIVLYANSIEEHSEKLRKLLARLQNAGLTLQPEKCRFLQREITYLGHNISSEGVKPDPEKIRAVKSFPIPKNKKNIKQFLGLVGYYRRFIPDMAKISKPLTRLLKADAPFVWDNDVQSTFENLRDTICSEPLLQFPDFNRPFLVTTDASNYAVGAVLSQGQIGKDLPIAYASRTLNSAETNYSTIEKELLAVVFAVDHFRPYLYGQQFTLVTDHRPLVWLHNVKDPISRIMRWRIKLNEYDYDIVYKPGKVNSNADALSRNPSDSTHLYQNSSPITKLTADHTETDYTDTPPSKRLQRVVVGANDASLADSEKEEGIDYDRLWENNEKLIATIFLTHETIFDGPPEVSIETEHSDDSSIDSDAYFTADEEMSPSLTTEISKRGGVPTKNVVVGGSFLRGRVDELRPGCLLDIGKADFKGTPPQNPLGAAHVPQGEQDTSDLGHRIGFKHPAQVHGLAPAACVWLGAETPNLEAERCRLLFETKFVDDETRSSVEMTSGNGDLLEQSNNRALTTETISLMPIIHYSSSPNIVYTKDYLYMRRDHAIHFFSLDNEVVSQTTKDLLTHNKFSLEQVKQHKLNIGETMVFPNAKPHIFHLYVKSLSTESVDHVHLESSIASLKHLMDSLDLKTVSISRKDNNIEPISWDLMEGLLKQELNNPQYTITVCTGEVVTPLPSRRPLIMKEFHESAIGGHQGARKLFDRIRENFYWPQMGKEIGNFVRSCSSCQKNKILRAKTKQPMRITDTPKRAFEKVQMDIVGPLPVTKKGNRYLLTLQDNLTKYSDAIPLLSIDSVTVAIALAEQFISRFGCPRTIQTDQGSNFVSNIMKTFCRIFKIQRITSTAFHPQSLGSLERAHRVFIDYLKHYCTKTDWDDWIRFGIFSYNTSVHEATGFTPHELVFGVKAIIPSGFIKHQIPRTFVDYLDNLFSKITTTQALAATNLERAKQRSKLIYDAKINTCKFSVGDDVYLLREPKTSKFDSSWLGPYKILKMFNDLNAEIGIGHNKTKIVHVNKLKLACISVNSS